MLVLAVLFSLTVYLYVSRVENDEFHGQFQKYANKVLLSLGQSFDGTLAAADSFVVGMVVSRLKNSFYCLQTGLAKETFLSFLITWLTSSFFYFSSL